MRCPSSTATRDELGRRCTRTAPRSAMAKSFNELRRKMSPERRRRNVAEAERMLLEMTVQELRENISNFSQKDIVDLLRCSNAPSKFCKLRLPLRSRAYPT